MINASRKLKETTKMITDEDKKIIKSGLISEIKKLEKFAMEGMRGRAVVSVPPFVGAVACSKDKVSVSYRKDPDFVFLEDFLEEIGFVIGRNDGKRLTPSYPVMRQYKKDLWRD